MVEDTDVASFQLRTHMLKSQHSVATVLPFHVKFYKIIKRQGPPSILAQELKALQLTRSHRNSVIHAISTQICTIICISVAKSLHIQGTENTCKKTIPQKTKHFASNHIKTKSIAIEYLNKETTQSPSHLDENLYTSM